MLITFDDRRRTSRQRFKFIVLCVCVWYSMVWYSMVWYLAVFIQLLVNFYQHIIHSFYFVNGKRVMTPNVSYNKCVLLF